MKNFPLVFMGLLLAIGAVLHAVIPGFILGMKPDMLLTMMFLGILLFPERKNVIIIGLVAGVLSALTTTFPSGQVPNMIDKPLTALTFFGLLLVVNKYRNSTVTAGILAAIGTIISGTIFLASASIFFSLPGSATFGALFVSVVLPAVALNTTLMVIIHPVAKAIMKRRSPAVSA